MTIRADQPACSVIVRKRIARRAGLSERYRGRNDVIDLTPFLGDGTSVQVRKGVREPAGTFAITLLDQLDTKALSNSLDSLVGILEPMDYVEIRIARRPHEYGGDLPILMRGWITSIRRSEAITSNGKPVRKIIITGHDYGKLLQSVQIFTGPRFEQGQTLLTEFRLFVKYGMSITLMSANVFARKVVDILNEWMRSMLAVTGAQEIPFLGLSATIPEGLVAPYSMQPFEGTLWSFLTDWIDIPWNEAFVEDRPDGPVLVVRATPYFDLSGRPIQGGYGGRADIADVVPDSDIVSLDTVRSDADVANYYWVDPPQIVLNTRELLIVDVIVSGANFLDNENSDLNLYGLRKMTERTNQIDGGVAPPMIQRNDESTLNDVKNKQRNWTVRRIETLKRMNGDNVLYERGSAALKGNERLRAGRYMEIERGDLAWTAYVTGVTHTFIPFDSYKTSIEFERGTGFYVRTAQEQSPYLKEIPRGLY
jgi:hypothetical protein